MSAESVALVRKFVDSFNRLDLEAVVDELDPEVELHEWPTAPGARTYHGSDGVRQALDSWFESWEWMQVEIDDLIEVGDRVLLTLNQRARGRGSTIEIEAKAFNVFTLKDGKVTLMQLFNDRGPAL